jgi:hypothetical protein
MKSELPAYRGSGGIAVNADSTFFATADSEKDRVFIYALQSDGTAQLHACYPAVGENAVTDAGLAHVRGTADICFARHDSSGDTLLVCTNEHILGITTDGALERILPLRSKATHISYRNNVIAVSYYGGDVTLLSYDSGVTIHSLRFGATVCGIAFTEDGLHLCVSDVGHNIHMIRVGDWEFVSTSTNFSFPVALLTGGGHDGITMASKAPGATSFDVVMGGSACVQRHPCERRHRYSFLGSWVVALAFMNHDLLVKTSDGALRVIRDD